MRRLYLFYVCEGTFLKVCKANRKNKTMRCNRYDPLIRIGSEVRSSNRELKLSWVGSMPRSLQRQLIITIVTSSQTIPIHEKRASICHASRQHRSWQPISHQRTSFCHSLCQPTSALRTFRTHHSSFDIQGSQDNSYFNN